MHVLSCNQAFKNSIKFVNYFEGQIVFFRLDSGVNFCKMALLKKKISKYFLRL